MCKFCATSDVRPCQRRNTQKDSQLKSFTFIDSFNEKKKKKKNKSLKSLSHEIGIKRLWKNSSSQQAPCCRLNIPQFVAKTRKKKRRKKKKARDVEERMEKKKGKDFPLHMKQRHSSCTSSIHVFLFIACDKESGLTPDVPAPSMILKKARCLDV